MAARVCKNGVVVASWTRQFSSKRTNDLVCLLVHEIRWLNYVCWMDGGMRLLCDTCLSKSSSGFVVQPLMFFYHGRVCVCVCRDLLWHQDVQEPWSMFRRRHCL